MWEIPFVLFKMVTTTIMSYLGECSLTDNVKGIARIHWVSLFKRYKDRCTSDLRRSRGDGKTETMGMERVEMLGTGNIWEVSHHWATKCKIKNQGLLRSFGDQDNRGAVSSEWLFTICKLVNATNQEKNLKKYLPSHYWVRGGWSRKGWDVREWNNGKSHELRDREREWCTLL